MVEADAGDAGHQPGEPVVELGVVHGEVLLGLEGLEHAAEVVSDKVLEQLLGRVALRLALLLEDLIGELGAGLEGETLRLAECVVAVEQDVLGLTLLVRAGGRRGGGVP